MASSGSIIEMVRDVLRQEQKIAFGDLLPAWDIFTADLEESADDDSFLASAIRLKALSLLGLNRVRDYSDMADLIEQSGFAVAVGVLADIDTHAGSSEGLPLTTSLVRRLGHVRPRKRATIGGSSTPKDPTAEEWDRTCRACITVAGRMIVLPGTSSTWTPETIATAIDQGGLESWRSILTTIGDDPWSPVAQHLIKAILEATDKGARVALREALLSVRRRVEHDEQQEVAVRVSDYIASTGITQRAFAARIGTSPSRLSTYANGSVTPSAAMMLRIAKVSAHLTAQRP